jgi:hypothetical protein
MKEEENLIPYNFQGGFTVFLLKDWTIEEENDLINVYSEVKPKGVLQISLYKKNNKYEVNDDELALQHLDRFIDQFNVIIDKNTYKILETDDVIIATTEGVVENRFINIWVIVDEKRMVLATYNSKEKTKELSIVEDIIYGIEFDK